MRSKEYAFALQFWLFCCGSELLRSGSTCPDFDRQHKAFSVSFLKDMSPAGHQLKDAQLSISCLESMSSSNLVGVSLLIRSEPVSSSSLERNKDVRQADSSESLENHAFEPRKLAHSALILCRAPSPRFSRSDQRRSGSLSIHNLDETG